MLQNAYLLAKIGADTAENEQHFAEILPTDALWRLCRIRRGPALDLARDSPAAARLAAPGYRQGDRQQGKQFFMHHSRKHG